MKLLALDTSSTACTVALLDSDRQASEQIISIHKIAAKQQGRLILPMIEELLQIAALNLKDLDGIVFGKGPGSFTGIRIASTVVQGIAYATQLPLYPISSMAAMAQSAFDHNQAWKNLLVAIDARMKQVYWAIYSTDQSGCVELIGKEAVYNPEMIALQNKDLGGAKIDQIDFILSRKTAADWVGIGSGWATYEKELSINLGFTPAVVNPSQQVNAQSLLKLARDKIVSRDQMKPEQALPTYLS